MVWIFLALVFLLWLVGVSFWYGLPLPAIPLVLWFVLGLIAGQRHQSKREQQTQRYYAALDCPEDQRTEEDGAE